MFYKEIKRVWDSCLDYCSAMQQNDSPHSWDDPIQLNSINFVKFISNSAVKRNEDKVYKTTLKWGQVSISLIFYEQFFHTKVFNAAFMCFQFGFVIFWRKDFGAKAVHKMLVKLTPGCRHKSDKRIFVVSSRNELWNG